MINMVTVFKKGEIRCQYDVVGFQAAVKSALVQLQKELETNIVHLMKDCTIDCRYLSKTEWACTITHRREEVFGLKVEKSN